MSWGDNNVLFCFKLLLKLCSEVLEKPLLSGRFFLTSTYVTYGTKEYEAISLVNFYYGLNALKGFLAYRIINYRKRF